MKTRDKDNFGRKKKEKEEDWNSHEEEKELKEGSREIRMNFTRKRRFLNFLNSDLRGHKITGFRWNKDFYFQAFTNFHLICLLLPGHAYYWKAQMTEFL